MIGEAWILEKAAVLPLGMEFVFGLDDEAA
jgi:hypothetical protein